MTPFLFPELLDSTMIVAFRRCPHYFFRAHCQGLGNSEPNIHLHSGGAFAAGMEAARRSYYVGQNAPERAVRDGVTRLIRYWGNYEPPPDEPKQLWRMVEAFLGYFQQWPLDMDPLHPYSTDKVPTIEFSFSYPLPFVHPVTGNPLLYGGRFDMLGQIVDDAYVVDEKTTGSYFSQDWGTGWDMRNQFIGYVDAAQQHGIPVSKVLIRGISIRKPPVRDTTPFAGLDFMQAIANIHKWQIERWRKDLYRTVRAMIGSWHDEYWARDWGDACHAFNRPCAFMPLCTSQEPENFESLFTVRHWNPLAKDPLEGAGLTDNIEVGAGITPQLPSSPSISPSILSIMESSL
jgi:hypothetical protein